MIDCYDFYVLPLVRQFAFRGQSSRSLSWEVIPHIGSEALSQTKETEEDTIKRAQGMVMLSLLVHDSYSNSTDYSARSEAELEETANRLLHLALGDNQLNLDNLGSVANCVKDELLKTLDVRNQTIQRIDIDGQEPLFIKFNEVEDEPDIPHVSDVSLGILHHITHYVARWVPFY